MFLKIFACVLSLLVLSESAYVDTLPKCSKDDENCQARMAEKMLRDIAKTGIPEIGIPPIDPLEIHNETLSILNVVDVTLNGHMKGLKKSIFNHFSVNFDERKAILDITFNVLISGHYKVFSNSPIVRSLFQGKNVTGDGEGKMKIEGLNIKINLPIELKKRGEDIYIHGKRKKLQYSFDVKKVIFAADNLIVGGKESSGEIVKFLNEQSSFLIQNFGKMIFDSQIDTAYNLVSKFMDNVPTKKLIKEDLTSYLA